MLWDAELPSIPLSGGREYYEGAMGGIAPIVQLEDPITHAPTTILSGFVVSVIDPEPKLLVYDENGFFQYAFGKYGSNTGEIQSIRAFPRLYLRDGSGAQASA